MANKNGITYYKLETDYEGDVTKYCGLTGAEIDANFFYLEGKDIKSVIWDSECQQLFFRRVNGEEFIVKIDLGNHYTKEEVNSLVEKLLENFKNNFNITVYHDSSLTGAGNIEKILTLSKTVLSGFHTPAKKLINTSEGESLPVVTEKGNVYLSYENISPCGLLYNWEAVKVIDERLKKLGSKWRIPTLRDWSYMLNAIEEKEYRNHISNLSNVDLGNRAGLYLKDKSGTWTITDEKGYSTNSQSDCCEESGCKGLVPLHYHADGTPCYGTNITNISGNTACGCCGSYINVNTVNSYGFNAIPCGYTDRRGRSFGYGEIAEYWTSTVNTATSDIWTKSIENDKDTVHQQAENIDSCYSLRFVRDLDDDFTDIEEVDGVLYHCIALPYIDENGFTKHQIWTVENVTESQLLSGDTCHPKAVAYEVLDNNGIKVKPVGRIMLNAWNGSIWERRELGENEVVVLVEGPDGSKNEEWVNQNGVLLKRSDIYTTIISNNIMDPINNHFKQNDEDISELDIRLRHEIRDREDADDAIWSGITREATESIKRDDTLQDNINKEESARTAYDEELLSLIKDEVSARTEDVEELLSLINDEASARTEDVADLQQQINEEVSARTEDVADLQRQIDEEVSARTEDVADLRNDLQQQIDEEVSARTEDVADLQQQINEEVSARTEDVADLQQQINEEASARTEDVADLQQQINEEASARTEDVADLQQQINEEASARTEYDKYILDNVGRIDENSGYTPNSEASYISSAKTIANSIDILDESLQNEEDERIANDVKQQTYTFGTTGGTLVTNNGTEIAIQFDGSFGNYTPKITE